MRHRLNKIVRTFGAAESICEFSDESLLFDCAPMWNDPRQSKMKNPGVTHARRDACRTVCRARMLLRWIYRFPVDRRRDAMRRIPASAPVPYSRRPAQGRRSAIDDPACRCLVEFRSRPKARRIVPMQLRSGRRCDVVLRGSLAAPKDFFVLSTRSGRNSFAGMPVTSSIFLSLLSSGFPSCSQRMMVNRVTPICCPSSPCERRLASR